MYEDVIEVSMDICQIKKLFDKLSVPYTIDRVNNDIIHIILWHGNEKFRMRFARGNCYDNFVFTGFLEG